MDPTGEWRSTRTGLPVAGALLLTLTGLCGGMRPQPVRAAAEAPAFSRLREVPLTLVENRGQVEGPVRYYVRGRDKSVYCTPAGVTFSARYAWGKAGSAGSC